jgi:hypothetical protein
MVVVVVEAEMEKRWEVAFLPFLHADATTAGGAGEEDSGYTGDCTTRDEKFFLLSCGGGKHRLTATQ